MFDQLWISKPKNNTSEEERWEIFFLMNRQTEGINFVAQI